MTVYTLKEFLLLSKKLQPQHSNVIRIYNVRSTSNTFFIVMECCNFSLDNQPEEFQNFMHGTLTGSNADPHPDSAAPCVGDIGCFVLNALVQDILRAVGFLHSKKVWTSLLRPHAARGLARLIPSYFFIGRYFIAISSQGIALWHLIALANTMTTNPNISAKHRSSCLTLACHA